jgi:PKD repeat protein
VNAEYNWWGSNSNPSSQVYGAVDYSNWLYMTEIVPTTIYNGSTTNVTVSFNNIWNGTDVVSIDPANGHIPDGTIVNFSSILGTFNPITAFTATNISSDFVNATTDNQIDSSPITVNWPVPVANFTADNTNVTEPQSVIQFNDQSTGNITSYSWDFGDGTTSTDQNPTHTYTAPGTYTVIETITGPGGSNNETLTNYITINPDTTAPVANASLASGIFNINQTVTLTATDNDPNLKIYYTLNGTTPTTSSTLYTGPLTINKEGTTTLEFIAVDTAGNISNTVTRTYTIDTTAPTASANPTGGLYNATENVSLSMSEAGNIYYTTDGTTPTNTSTLYSGPIMVNKNTTLRYIAIDEASNVSSVYTQTYTIDKTIPTASANVKGGLYKSNQIITLKLSEPGNIYYTLNGSTPTSKSTLYTKPITISSTSTLKYLAIDLANNKSSTYIQNYVIDKTAPKVVSTTPVNNAKGVSLTEPITIKFSEKINKGTNFSKIYVKNMTTGKITQATITLSGNTITIKMTRSRLSLDNYQVYIPTSAVKDLAGNNNSQYVLKFKTSRY